MIYPRTQRISVWSLSPAPEFLQSKYQVLSRYNLGNDGAKNNNLSIVNTHTCNMHTHTITHMYLDTQMPCTCMHACAHTLDHYCFHLLTLPVLFNLLVYLWQIQIETICQVLNLRNKWMHAFSVWFGVWANWIFFFNIRNLQNIKYSEKEVGG